MANIVTSYYEIYRLDGKHISNTDRGRLIGGIVRKHDKFGSYWVRIHVEYNQSLRCLRIQFGGSNSYNTNIMLDSQWYTSQFFHWQREADECGTRDGLYVEFVPDILRSMFRIFGMKNVYGEQLDTVLTEFF